MPVDRPSSPPAYHLFIGVDIAAATFTAVSLVPGAAPGRAHTLDQTSQGFTALQARLLGAGHAPGQHPGGDGSDRFVHAPQDSAKEGRPAARLVAVEG